LCVESTMLLTIKRFIFRHDLINSTSVVVIARRLLNISTTPAKYFNESLTTAQTFESGLPTKLKSPRESKDTFLY
jgi:hypothetical protein